MEVTFNCKVSLSKKLRALMGKSGRVMLTVNDVVEGRGEGTLYISGECQTEILTLTEELKGETSIMMTPIELVNAVAPNNGSVCHASIFSTSVTNGEESPVVRKLAVITPPEKGREGRAVKQNIETPKAFEEIDNHECKQWISNMTELIEAVNVAKNKKSTIDLNSAQNDRERAVMLEMREKEEAIDKSAWIVNEKAGSMFINDLNISLPLNSPYDLSNISAKRIATSKDLRGLFNAGMLKFIAPEDRELYIAAIEEDEQRSSGLEVFDRHEDAEQSISGMVEDNDPPVRARSPVRSRSQAKDKDLIQIEEISDDNAEEVTENEDMIINLTQNMPKVRTTHISSPRPQPTQSSHTVHGNDAPKKPSSVKTIRKIE